MLGSNNYLGLTGDERVDAGRARGAGALRHRADRLAPAERHDRPAPRARGASSPTGWAPRTRSCSRPGTRPTSARSGRSSAPGDTVVVDSGDHASILDGCILSRAKLRAVPPQPARQARADARARGRRRRRHPRRRRRRLLDGGRRRAAAARSPSCAARYGARLMVDEAHARRRARRARRRRDRAARRRGPGRPADGHVLQVARLLRRLDRRAGRRDRVPADRRRGRSCSPPRRVPAAVGAALAAVRICRSDGGPRAVRRACSTTRATSTAGLHELGFHVVEPTPLPDGTDVVTPIVPVLVGDDWKAALLWKALYDAGVLRQRRAPPGGPAGRRAAAHERDGDPRSRRPSTGRSRPSPRSSARSRPSTGRCPRAVLASTSPGLRERSRARLVHTRTSAADDKKDAMSTSGRTCDLAVTRAVT